MIDRHARALHDWGDQETFQEVLAEQCKRAPWLGISIGLHCMVIFLLWNVQWQEQGNSVERITNVVETPTDEPIADEPLEPEPQEEIKAEEVQDIPVIEETQTVESAEEPTDLPNDSLDFDTPFDDTQFNDIIGLGGGKGGKPGGGHIGNRTGRKSPKIAPRVQKALHWLARHQEEDGRWDTDGFDSHCKEERCSGPGQPQHDIGVTGLALLAFLGDGNTLRYGPFKKNVKRAVKWLKDQQDDEGLFGEKVGQSYMYSHIIATIAMCEAFGLSRARVLKPCVQKAINYVASARNPYKAWRYTPRDGDNDSSVTGWAVIALSSAESFKDLGLRVPADGFKGALTWLDEMTDPNTGRIGYLDRGSLTARPQELKADFPAARSEAMTAVGLLARFFAHQDPRENPVMQAHARLIASKPPVWNEKDGSIDMYYWYYGTFAMYQVGGSLWKRWNRSMQQAVIASQRQQGCAAGSWDPVGVWGEEGGRVYATAMMAMCLEVYYRYSQIFRAR